MCNLLKLFQGVNNVSLDLRKTWKKLGNSYLG